MAGKDRKVKEDTLAGLGSKVYQVILALRDPEVNRERGGLMVAQVTQETQDSLVIKVHVVHQDYQDHFIT